MAGIGHFQQRGLSKMLVRLPPATCRLCASSSSWTVTVDSNCNGELVDNTFIFTFGKAGLCDRRDVEEQISISPRCEHCEHYTGHGITKFRESGGAPCCGYGSTRFQDVGIDRSPQKGSGKSRDETSHKMGSGKKFLHNAISEADFAFC